MKPELKNALDSNDELEITVMGRRSGKSLSLSVWFVRDGNQLFLLPIKGSKSSWYKNVSEKPNIGIAVGPIKISTMARVATDSGKVREIVQKFRNKYGVGDVKKYYTNFDACVAIDL